MLRSNTTTIMVFIFFPFFSVATDTITPTKPLIGNQTLVSSGQVFELGFFDPGNSTWYLGIWYKQISPITYVWVANRDTPIYPRPGKLTIVDNGNLLVLNEAEITVWRSNTSVKVVNTVAQLLDNGNLVVRPENDENPENYIWESFNNPTDTLLPGMKLGWDRKTGVNRFLQSWKTGLDPGSGKYYVKMNIDGFPEIFVFKNETGMKKLYRSGPWNGRRFSGVQEMQSVSLIEHKFENKYNEVSYTFEMMNSTSAYSYSRFVISYSGLLQRFTWVELSQTWSQYWTVPSDQCDNYGECGPGGVCDANANPSLICKCMKGFRPKNKWAWDLQDGSDGCVRGSEMNCRSDGFLLLRNVKLPESSNVYVNETLSLNECGEICRRNCSCTAYANMDISGSGSGCVIWAVDLLDIKQFEYSEGGQDLYVRTPGSDLVQSSDQSLTFGKTENGAGNNIVLKVVFAAGTCAVIVILLILFILRRKKMQRFKNSNRVRNGQHERTHAFLMNEAVTESCKRDCGETTDVLELPLFDYTSLVTATNNFSDANKLGQGGFGCVYKGILMEGQVVAVKRLSKTSGQGIDELKNEVQLIAKLQHRNLVRLVGCCIEVEEKLLVYEYMEHKSLDTFLFDKKKSAQLDWQKRFNIICGIARGLLYLHQDSRFRIIHRDLKVSNILLDTNMNPKISDFGLARIFGGDQTQAETKKVAGTYGYMSPEYAIYGLFSTKSDVFSFGVLMLEIVSGKRNTAFYCASNLLNLIGHTWNLWREGNALELLDVSIGDKFSQDEVLRCIQIGLLCVQEFAKDRPNMSQVLLMLNSDAINLPQPKSPGFSLGKKVYEKESSVKKEPLTLNIVTLTTLDGR